MRWEEKETIKSVAANVIFILSPISTCKNASGNTNASGNVIVCTMLNAFFDSECFPAACFPNDQGKLPPVKVIRDVHTVTKKLSLSKFKDLFDIVEEVIGVDTNCLY